MTLYSTEDARKKISNQYEMTLIAATRLRELGPNRPHNAPSIVLKEVADGKIDMEYYRKSLKEKK